MPTFLRRLLTRLGHYYSTHCLHDDHVACKGSCKNCTAPCSCDCHA